MKNMWIAMTFAGLLVVGLSGESRAAGPGAKALLDGAKVRGGLCLVIGAKDTSLAADLAGKSTLYVQLLQPDARTAAQWGAKVAVAPCRESVGVRNAAFDAEHYGKNLFNLVVVEDAAALGKAKLADLYRILVPNGVVAFKSAPGGLAKGSKALKMTAVAAAGFAAAFRKPVVPVKWKPPLELKWQAGPRSQIANGYAGITTAAGKLFYLERTERDQGDLKISRARVYARDAYNGRTLWTCDVPGNWGRYGGIAASDGGKVYVRTGQHKVISLDGATGKVLSEVVPKVYREARIGRLNADLMLAAGQVYSMATGKRLWKFPSYRYQTLRGTIIGKNVYFCDSKNILAKELASGKELWKVPAGTLPKPIGTKSLSRAGKYLLARMKGTKDTCAIAILDPAAGKLLWTYSWKVRISKKERYFNASKVRLTTTGNELLVYYRHNKPNSYADEVVITKLDLATGREKVKDKILADAGDFHGCFGELQLGDYIAWYDLWVNKKKLETVRQHTPHPACFFGSNHAYGLLFNFPSRKSGPITAVGPADKVFDKAPGGKILKKFGRASSTEATRPGDWPVFRGGAAGGNSCKARLGDKLVKAWEAPVGLGKTDFGLMSGQRTGLTQAVVAYGLAVVGDIDGGRLVALDVKDGKQKWAYHVGSRVDYPPTLYKGLCLVAARDGWVYCLDARTGRLVYKLLVPARERYIGGREKLESVWPLTSDVFVVGGTAYVSGGGGGGLAFKPETGQVAGAKDPGKIALGRRAVPGGRDLQLSYDMLIKGNSIPRTNEDNVHGFRRGKFRRRLDARVLAFDDTMTVAYKFRPRGEGWANRGLLHIEGIGKDPKKPLWKSEPIELVVDDMVLTPEHVYCAGHYQRIKRKPELWVLSRKDGKVLKKIAVGGFPAFMGASAAGKRLFIATREGKLICFEGK